MYIYTKTKQDEKGNFNRFNDVPYCDGDGTEN